MLVQFLFDPFLQALFKPFIEADFLLLRSTKKLPYDPVDGNALLFEYPANRTTGEMDLQLQFLAERNFAKLLFLYQKSCFPAVVLYFL